MRKRRRIYDYLLGLNLFVGLEDFFKNTDSLRVALYMPVAVPFCSN